MAFEKIERKMKKLQNAIKKGRVTEEIADEVSAIMREVEGLGKDAKKKFSDTLQDMEKAIKKMK